jgi:pimeloyl-ACP methyl ester carboxylesterase
VYLKGGKKLVGRVVSEGDEVVVNPYNSSHPEMVFGIVRVPGSKVKRIDRTTPSPAQEFHQKLAEAINADACIEIANWCAEHKLKLERRWALETALRFDPDHAAAKKALGRKAPGGRWPDQVELAKRLLEVPEAERAAVYSEIRADRSYPFSLRYLQRAVRSRSQKRGYQRDRPVALRADKLKTGACYTLHVPKSYDALRPTPLVIGLHGGGAGGADGKLVVGSGSQAMNFYQHRCERRGWICACPTALQAGWRGAANDGLIDAIVDELAALYNIDENRIYLVGHSMGGGGTWQQGARRPEMWAAVAPAASYGVQGIESFGKTRTGFYVYHSEDDPRTRIGGVRPRMKNLPGSGLDFVYTELKDRGHAFPPEVINDIFGFFAVRRLARGPGRFKPTVRPRSSFLRKLSRDEKKYLPALPVIDKAGGDGGADEKLTKLMKQLKTGGGVAENAVPKLVALKEPKTDAAVGRVITKSSTAPDVRRYGARILGERKAVTQVKALGRMLLQETDSQALLAGLDALEQIGAPEAGDAIVLFLAKRQSYLDQRATSGRLDNSDWTTITPPMARACELIATFRPKRGMTIIVDRVLEKVLMGKVSVVFDRVNQNPLPAGQALARAACAALARMGDKGALPALKKMRDAGGKARRIPIQHLRSPVSIMSGWPQDPRIAGEVRAAIDALTR